MLVLPMRKVRYSKAKVLNQVYLCLKPWQSFSTARMTCILNQAYLSGSISCVDFHLLFLIQSDQNFSSLICVFDLCHFNPSMEGKDIKGRIRRLPLILALKISFNNGLFIFTNMLIIIIIYCVSNSDKRLIIQVPYFCAQKHNLNSRNFRWGQIGRLRANNRDLDLRLSVW